MVPANLFRALEGSTNILGVPSARSATPRPVRPVLISRLRYIMSHAQRIHYMSLKEVQITLRIYVILKIPSGRHQRMIRLPLQYKQVSPVTEHRSHRIIYRKCNLNLFREEVNLCLESMPMIPSTIIRSLPFNRTALQMYAEF